MGMQQTSVQVELPNTTGQTGTSKLVISFIFARVYFDHSGMEGASSRITVESSGSLKQDNDLSFGFWDLHYGYYYLNGSTTLRSLIYVDVGEPTSHPCSMTGRIQDHYLLAPQYFESLGTSMSGICYDIAKQY